MDEHDLVIIGAGPAGASAGFFLKKLRPETDVLMMDRLGSEKYDRYHRMCGEALSKRTFNDLAPIVPTDVVHQISKVQEVWPGGTVLETRAKGYILDRPRFLKGVLSQYRDLGGLLETDALGSIASVGDGFELTLTSGRRVKARHVIGADGAHSTVRRSLFREEPPLMMWTEQFLVRKKLESDTITFIQGERYRGGYRWEFPAGDLARIGFPRGVEAVEDEIVETHRRVIPGGGLSRIVHGNAALVGDAAAMANPLTAGGIRVSMLSGKKAAEAIVAGDMAQYQRWWLSSPFAQDKYLKAFRKFEAMTDQDYVRAARGFGGPVRPLPMVWAYLTRPEFRDLYKAYGPSGKYGW